jgi:methylated-DNA-[protein]-cysteine S-methyltransferase
MAERYHADLKTSLGTVSFAVDRAGRLVEVAFGPGVPGQPGDAVRCRRVRDALAEYFAGSRTVFDLELAPAGTPFQRRVWQALTEIPYGQVVSYGEIARRIGMPKAARAVGQANGANPIPVVIPCHRVIAADGTIGGYSGGLDIKRQLLGIERVRLAA